MKTKTCLGAIVIAIAALAFVSGPAWAGISSTKHNLGTSGAGSNDYGVETGTAAICVFCHTPHGADTSAPVPLWNRQMSAAGAYTTYASMGTTTLDTEDAPTGSVSLACLSCHDGTQAMDVMINTPGSGGFNAGGVVDAAYVWNAGFGDTIGGIDVGITLIGTDLQDDHPVSIQYAGGGYDSTDGDGLVADGVACTTCTDGDFFEPSKGTLGGTPVWWVNESTGTNNREKTDMLLYTRAAVDGYGGQVNAEPYVECASCHDPHTENATFLRVENTGSAVCLACHNK